MNTFTIPCETFSRLIHAASPLGINTPYTSLNIVRVEHLNGHKYAVATNSRVLACQYLGETDEPDGAANILISDALIQQCRVEADFDGVLTVTVIPGANYATANTTFGFNYPHNAVNFDESIGGLHLSVWRDWRNLIPTETPKKNSGHMYLTGEWIAQLGYAAPSGRIVFPAFIDTKFPVIVRDAVDPDWFGMFLATSSVATKAAVRPEWI